MTLSDFLAASQGDERLGAAKWLYWLCNMSTSDHVSHMSADELTGSDADAAYYDPNWFDVADAVLAELARQRKESWEDGFETGMHTPSCFSSNS